MLSYTFKDRTGYTLVETVVSVALAGIAITALMLSMSSGIYFSDDNHLRQYALNALREEIEIVRTAAFDDVEDMDGDAFTNDQIDKLREGSGAIDVADSLGDDIKVVTLTVSWETRGGATKTESLTTRISRVGLNRA